MGRITQARDDCLRRKALCVCVCVCVRAACAETSASVHDMLGAYGSGVGWVVAPAQEEPTWRCASEQTMASSWCLDGQQS